MINKLTQVQERRRRSHLVPTTESRGFWLYIPTVLCTDHDGIRYCNRSLCKPVLHWTYLTKRNKNMANFVRGTHKNLPSGKRFLLICNCEPFHSDRIVLLEQLVSDGALQLHRQSWDLFLCWIMLPFCFSYLRRSGH